VIWEVFESKLRAGSNKIFAKQSEMDCRSPM